MDDARLRGFAEGAVRGSRRHMVMSLLVCGAVEAFEISVHASAGVHAGVIGILVFLVVYNVLRIRLARRALAAGTADALRAFVHGQKRSHLVRGRIFLIACPVVVAAGWASTLYELRSTDRPAIYVVAMLATTAFLAWGWLFWWRGLRRVAQWQP